MAQVQEIKEAILANVVDEKLYSKVCLTYLNQEQMSKVNQLKNYLSVVDELKKIIPDYVFEDDSDETIFPL